MKKFMISAAIVAAIVCAAYAHTSDNTTNASDNKDGIEYADTVSEAIDVVYIASCNYLSELYDEPVRYDDTASDSEKLAVIREADSTDLYGDVIAEMPEYDVVSEILYSNDDE